MPPLVIIVIVKKILPFRVEWMISALFLEDTSNVINIVVFFLLFSSAVTCVRTKAHWAHIAHTQSCHYNGKNTPERCFFSFFLCCEHIKICSTSNLIGHIPPCLEGHCSLVSGWLKPQVKSITLRLKHVIWFDHPLRTWPNKQNSGFCVRLTSEDMIHQQIKK